jgi:hypothetical protein
MGALPTALLPTTAEARIKRPAPCDVTRARLPMAEGLTRQRLMAPGGIADPAEAARCFRLPRAAGAFCNAA